MPKLWLAPLHGLTLYHFRNCLFRHSSGFDAAISPFMPVQEKAKLNVRKWKDFDPKNNQCVETIPQLMGIILSHFADTMNALYDEYGISHFNWNLGCPMAPIVRKRRGCGLMPYPDEVEAVVETACKLPYHFSVKMRLGMHAVEEGLEIIKRLNNYPLEFIVIHPRLGIQQYGGKPDLEALEQFLSFTKHRVIYSGDVFQISDYQMLNERFPQIQDWMLGRGAIRNPFLVEQIKREASKQDDFNRFCDDKENLLSAKYDIERFKDFYDDLTSTLVAYRGENATLPVLKELWHYFAHFFQLADEQLHSLLVILDFGEFDAAVKKLLFS